jgi:hypothetical protein
VLVRQTPVCHLGPIERSALVLNAQASIAGMDECEIILMVIHLPHQRARKQCKAVGNPQRSMALLWSEELFRAYVMIIGQGLLIQLISDIKDFHGQI